MPAPATATQRRGAPSDSPNAYAWTPLRSSSPPTMTPRGRSIGTRGLGRFDGVGSKPFSLDGEGDKQVKNAAAPYCAKS